MTFGDFAKTYFPTSTDTRQKHYLVVLFQAIENNTPKVYFYRLLPIGEDETAVGLLNVMKEAFQQDGIENKIKAILVGFTADGASVMLGAPDSRY